jgi:hypothetical protein
LADLVCAKALALTFNTAVLDFGLRSNLLAILATLGLVCFRFGILIPFMGNKDEPSFLITTRHRIFQRLRFAWGSIADAIEPQLFYLGKTQKQKALSPKADAKMRFPLTVMYGRHIRTWSGLGCGLIFLIAM